MGKKKKSVFFQKFVLSRNQCTTRIQETWLQTGFPCQLKLVFRQKPVPSLPRSWQKPTVPDSENFAQCVHSSKITFFWKKIFTKHTVGGVWLFGRKEFSPTVIGRSAHMPNTRGKQLEQSTGEHSCVIVTMMQFASSSRQLSINRECIVEEREYRDWYLLFPWICTLSLSLSDDYWVCKIVVICCLQ